MKINETVGIDVSKLTIDAFIYSKRLHKQFKNSADGFASLMEWIRKNISVPIEEAYICFEHTGLYSLPLSVYLTEHMHPFSMISGLELKRSQGLKRGKDDKADAEAIALYAYRRREELEPYTLPSVKLLELRKLLSLRDKIVRQRAGYKVSAGEARHAGCDGGVFGEVHEALIQALDNEVLKLDKRLREIIKSDKKLDWQFSLVSSIKGVGEQTSMYMIVYTNAFTLFSDSRKFASYAGIAPFPNRSGTSIRGRDSVSPMANLKMKSLLSNCATSAITCSPEMKEYYKRRLEAGKDKMSTINIVRNKILGRIFAAVKRGTPYVDTMKYKAGTAAPAPGPAACKACGPDNGGNSEPAKKDSTKQE